MVEFQGFAEGAVIMTVVSVNKPRGGELVAWRAWACSSKDFKHHQGVIDEALDFMIDNELLTIGYNDDPLSGYPATWPKFKALWSTRQRTNQLGAIPFYFAFRMKKGDLIVLSRNQKHIEAYGYLADNELRYVDKKHPLYRKVMRLQDLTNEVYASKGEPDSVECFRNYRLVDKWIIVDGPPKTAGGKLSGSIKPTIAAVRMQEGLHWLGLADEPTQQTRSGSAKKRKGRKKKTDPWAGPHLSHLTEKLVRDALVHYELHLREQHPTDTPVQAPFVIKFDGKLYQPWPVIVHATSEEFRSKFKYTPPDSPLCGRLRAIGFPVVRHPDMQASSN